MTSKFKIEYYHKLPQNTSPYLQLLQAKKKIFGYKYQLIRSTDNPSKHNTSTHHNKSIGHAQPSHKHSKTQSHQKQKARSQKQHSRKKRSHTEQAEERMHESLFLNREGTAENVGQKEGKHQATKSLFTVQGNIDQSLNPNEFMRNYRNMIDHDDSKNIKSLTQQIQHKQIPRGGAISHHGHSLDKLQITEIDELINLIDSCVEQANDYIGYLTQKIEHLKQENHSIKEEQIKLIKMKDGIINEKENQIDRLKKQLHSQQAQQHQMDKTFQIKKLLQVISKVTEQNNVMKLRLRQLGESGLNSKDYSEKEKKDIYNSIHNKIDILNISIDKKNQENPLPEPQPLRDTRKHKNKQPRFYK